MFKFLILLVILGAAKAQDLAAFNQAGLEECNAMRALHGNPPLELDDRLTQEAQAYADKLSAENKYDHDESTEDGENLYLGNGLDKDESYEEIAKKAVQAWYSEIKDYNFDAPTVDMKTGHFTQLVWKETNKVGMGIATQEDAEGTMTARVVARFNPAGNFDGEYPENIPKPVA